MQACVSEAAGRRLKEQERNHQLMGSFRSQGWGWQTFERGRAREGDGHSAVMAMASGEATSLADTWFGLQRWLFTPQLCWAAFDEIRWCVLIIFFFPCLWEHYSETQRHSERRRTEACVYTRSSFGAFHRTRHFWAKSKGREYPVGVATAASTGALYRHAAIPQPIGSGSPTPPSSSAPGKTLMNFKNGWREHVRSPQRCLEAWTVAQEEFTLFQRTAGRIILLMLGVP